MRKAISQLNMLSPEEYRHITCGLNDTAADYPKDKCVHTLFEEQVKKTPEKTAVIACDRELAYGELNEQANRIAHSLIVKGIQPGDIVAFMLPRRSYLLSVMFGILKSGAAYLPIDPDYPQERIDYMLSDSGAKLCITEENIPDLLANERKENLDIQVASDHPCYCIYTSGSTGKPKGTMIRHKNLNNFCQYNSNNHHSFVIRDCDRVASVFKACFDAFQVDATLFLLNGKSIILISDDMLTDYSEVASAIEMYGVDVLHCTPTMLHTMIEKENFCFALKNIRVCICGAEQFAPDLFLELKKHTDACILNGYGPSETTVAVSFGNIQTSEESQRCQWTNCINEICAISKVEYKILTIAFNNTVVDYPKEKCVHTLFEEQAEKDPDKVAVIACDRELAYGELNRQANRIAHSLIDIGIQPGDIVAFMLPRISYLLSVMFGILKSGATYLPIDPDYPQDRIDYMLSDSGAKLCITEENLPILLTNECIDNPNVQLTSNHPCYCIYTSGSTGKPKGTILTHATVNNYTQNNHNNVVHSVIRESYKTIVSITTAGFDIFVTESILPLLNAMTIVLANEGQAKLQKELNRLLKEHPCDVMQTTPTKMRSLIADEQERAYLQQLKVIILGGEALDRALVDQLRSYTDAEIFNIYGPTETTVWSTNTKINI